GFSCMSDGMAILKIFCDGMSADSIQYTTGPLFTATWLRVSSTIGLDSINVAGISNTSSIRSPFFQDWFKVKYFPPARSVLIVLPFTLTEALWHQPGIRK